MNSIKSILCIIVLASVFSSFGATCPSRLTCEEIREQLTEINSAQQACCDELNACLDQINQLLDTYTCSQPVIFIDQNFMDTATLNPITQPGNYCLTESVMGRLVIDSDDVVVNLNDYSISGTDTLIEAANHQNIMVQNGLLLNAVVNGLLFQNCTNCVLEDLIADGCATGFSFENVFCFDVKNCTTQNATTRGLSLFQSIEGRVSDFTVQNSDVEQGVFLQLCRNLLLKNILVCNNSITVTPARLVGLFNNVSCVFEKCSLVNNTGVNELSGFFINNTRGCSFKNCLVHSLFGVSVESYRFNTGSRDCVLKDCASLEVGVIGFPTTTSRGFYVTSLASNIVLDSCLAIATRANGQAGEGFLVEECDAVCVVNCFAKANTRTGFTSGSNNNAYFFNNTSLNNTDFGFRRLGLNNDSLFLGNFGEGSGVTEYEGGIPSVIRFDVSAGEFRDPLNSCTAVSPSDWNNIAVTLCPQP